ncbi:hypothetical protein ACFQWB_06435 [Paenibacillus thermoaerophilus]|uniref:YtkA-like n=1 Tax=Paenibacillus thermoaerophilus TaxID=1215385 RepID=A0ABW2V2B8_9BACL|nr:hypothetical protein [Paenibacillus thermoaerophilus]TMV18168.1 hypothetical protein FE781_04225 [Paenibacillus thermoaerophilus]
MSKKWIPILLGLAVLLSACGSESWENEHVDYVSQRIMQDHVRTEWTLDGGPSSGEGEGRTIRIEIRKDDGEPIHDFDVTHEKLLHLIVVSKDLSYFDHIHPEYKGNGVFEIGHEFPAGGEYRLIADFKPTGGDAMTEMKWIEVEGQRAEPTPIMPETYWLTTVEGKRVTLNVDRLAVNQETKLTFCIEDDRTNQPVTDLEPYLGAIGHVVILSEDGERYVHVHADEGQNTGPNAVFETSFPRSGIYKIWGQFQQDGRVFTVSYVVKVP